MIEIIDILIIIMSHFVCDFVLQTREMGRNKSQSIKWLTIHASVYAISLGCILLMAHSIMMITLWSALLAFIAINFILHWTTDLISSKVTSYCYKQNEYSHNNAWEYLFWTVIGLDQMIHMFTLFLSYYLINSSL